MGRGMKSLIGIIKDKASLLSADPLRLAVLRATSHDPTAPPDPAHLLALFSVGDGSRATAAAVVAALMDRLQSTSSSAVAAKCLLTVHHILRRGPFILRDQLSFFPTGGGRNYLNLSNFRDDSSPGAWHLSAYVRWYGGYIESLLATSRTIGSLFQTSSGAAKERISGMVNHDLLRELDSITSVIEEAHKIPESVDSVRHDKLVDQAVALVGEDYFSLMGEISDQVDEFRNRVNLVSFSESVELGCCLRRLEDCRERLTAVFARKVLLMASFWASVRELKGEMGKAKASVKEGRSVVTGGRRKEPSESARFGDPVGPIRVTMGNSSRFGYSEPPAGEW